MNTDQMTFDEIGMVVKGLDEYAKTLRKSASSRKNAGTGNAAHRTRLRELAARYSSLARDFEKELVK